MIKIMPKFSKKSYEKYFEVLANNVANPTFVVGKPLNLYRTDKVLELLSVNKSIFTKFLQEGRKIGVIGTWGEDIYVINPFYATELEYIQSIYAVMWLDATEHLRSESVNKTIDDQFMKFVDCDEMFNILKFNKFLKSLEK